jgi:hypothetical protein
MEQTTDFATHDADVADVVNLLRTRKAQAIDVVAPLTTVGARGGLIEVEGIDPQFVEDDDGFPVGVNNPNGSYLPSRVAINHLGTMLKIPTRFLADARESRPRLFDHNVNAMIHGRDAAEWGYADDVDAATNRVMFRLLRAADDNTPGILRAVLSDSYKSIDDLDVLLAVLAGLSDAGLDIGPGNLSLDVTERKMYGRVVAPQIAALAPALLHGYRSPFDGDDGPGHDVGNGWTPERLAEIAGRERAAFDAGAEPVVFAGFAFQNSEVGHGAFDITPRLVVQVCNNGLTISADALRKIHVGAKLDAGVVKWSEKTVKKNLDLITSQTADAVGTFLDPGYLRAKIDEMEQFAEVKIARPEEAIKAVARKFAFTEDQRASILDKFIKGGQPTAGGVMQAVTAAARVTRELDGDPDTAAELEALAVPVLKFAAAGAR